MSLYMTAIDYTLDHMYFLIDRWSFGIVLYEIYTLGGVPYPGMDGRYVISKLQQGYRMERPSMCPEDM